MRKEHSLPTKIIDDFFEIPSVWRHYGLKQEYFSDARQPGSQSHTLDILNINLFHKLASKIMTHLTGYTYFQSLQVGFGSVDSTYGQGWIRKADAKWNVAGQIFLTPNPPEHTGIQLYNKLRDFDHDYDQIFAEEMAASPDNRAPFQKYKFEQQSSFRKVLTVGNLYNRCVIFNAESWYADSSFFGDTLDTSRLTINFFGHAK